MKPTTRAKIRFLALGGVMLASVVTTLAADDKWWGYTGPGNGSVGAFPDVPVIAIKQAKTMRDDAFVALEGRIERAVKKNLYILTDGEDSITVEIDKHLWYGLTVGPDDTVLIYGELDRHLSGVILEAHRIMIK